MPVYVEFTLVCDRQGCGGNEVISREYAVPSQPITGPALPTGWQEYNGLLLCPDCHDCTDG